MNKEKAIAIVDVGTQSMRTILYNKLGESLYTSQLPYSPIFNGIEVEQDPRTWKDTLYATLKDINDYAKKNKITKSFNNSCQSSRQGVI